MYDFKSVKCNFLFKHLSNCHFRGGRGCRAADTQLRAPSCLIMKGTKMFNCLLC